MLSWPDENILRLIQAAGFVSTEEPNWQVITANVNQELWPWDPAECEQAWGELQSMKPTRLGDFSKLEDEILAERVVGWGRDQRGLWRWMGNYLKRDHIVLCRRWDELQKRKEGCNNDRR